MLKNVIILTVLFVGITVAQNFQRNQQNNRYNPYNQPQPYRRPQPQPTPAPQPPRIRAQNEEQYFKQAAEATILKQTQEDNGDGSFSWSFENSDGTAQEQRGYIKNPGTDSAIQVMEGSYTYYDIDGKLNRIRYIADEGGFQILEDTRVV